MADFTAAGLEKLKKELEYLKTVKRKEMAERLKSAIAFGDLKENAAYHEAKESQGFLEGRIRELEKTLTNAKIVQKSSSNRIMLGSKILLEMDGQTQELRIVGTNEADSLKNKISNASPLGQELIGKKPGHRGEFKTLTGKISYKIISIQ